MPTKKTTTNRKRNVRTVKAKPTAKAAKPTTETKAAKQPDAKATEKRKHDIALTYAGPSPTVRGHERKLSGIRTDLGAARVTERDETFIADIVRQYKANPFTRYDTDAGCIRRAIAHGFLEHVSGDLGSQSARFKATARGVEFAGNRNSR